MAWRNVSLHGRRLILGDQDWNGWCFFFFFSYLITMSKISSSKKIMIDEIVDLHLTSVYAAA